MQRKVEEIQEYLKAKGIEVSETAIVEAAINIARRFGPGDWVFACEFKQEKKNREEMYERCETSRYT